jgi:hypothetical protein
MPDRNLFDRYLLALRKTPVDEKTEHTDRAALQTLLQAVADDGASGIAVQHEPKRVADKGAPDFKVTKGGLILGYVENKTIGEVLDKVLKSNQITRYKSLSQNIILTAYLHFIWINKDGIQRETLCHLTDLESPKFRLHEDRIAAVRKLLQGFFSTAPEGIGRAQQLALALATRSKLLHDYLGEELVRQEREHKQGRLYGLFQIFRDQIFNELTLNEFADAFAQMLAYGLFLARLNSSSNPITLHNAREYVPGSFRLIRELVDFLTELEKPEYRDVRWVVEEVLSIVNALDLPAIQEDLSAQGDQPQGARRRRGRTPAVRARPLHLFLRGLPEGLRQRHAEGPGRLLHAAADCEFHRACGERHSEGELRYSRWARRQQARDRARLRLRHWYILVGGIPTHLRQYWRSGRRTRRPDRA